MAYFITRGWSNETVGKLMAWQTENQAAGEEGAKHFLAENKDLLSKWVPTDVAEKVAAASSQNARRVTRRTSRFLSIPLKALMG